MFANDKNIDNLQQLLAELKKYAELQKDYVKLHLVEKIQEQEKLTKTIIDKIVDIKQDLLQNRDCANLIPKVENIEDICREMLK